MASTIEVESTSRAQVESLLGRPGGVVSLRDPLNGCRERWSYSGMRDGEREEVMFVDFDDRGRVCDLALGYTALMP